MSSNTFLRNEGQKIPRNETECKIAAGPFGGSTSTSLDIHTVPEPKPGSLISRQQFLALRTLWVRKKAAEFEVSKFIDVNYHLEAVASLKANPPWYNYIESLKPHSKPPEPFLQAFWSVSDWQAEIISANHKETIVSGNETDTLDKVEFTPELERRRRDGQLPSQPLSPSVEKSRRTKKGDMIENTEAEDLDAEDNSDESEPPNNFLDLLANLKLNTESENIADQFPVKDESITNCALITKLRCITGYNSNLGARWNHIKARLRLNGPAWMKEGKQKVYHADTDGLLLSNDGESILAIVEVKPFMRGGDKQTNKILMQETAQMAALVQQEARRKGLVKEANLSTKYGQVLVSQDQHEIFLTFAKYDQRYVNYLNDGSTTSTRRAFMTMNEFGPWPTNDAEAMEQLDSIILALTMQQADSRLTSGR